jgi:hypothetical protein
MRTVTFLGLIAIADAIRKDWYNNSQLIHFFALIFFIAIIMDVCEFLKKMNSKN